MVKYTHVIKESQTNFDIHSEYILTIHVKFIYNYNFLSFGVVSEI